MSIKTKAKAPEPARVVVLRPSAFVATWQGRPVDEVAVGLRLLSHEETMTAAAEAAKEAVGGGREGDVAEERYRHALCCWTVGYALCDPNDASKPYWPTGDEAVRSRLTPEATAHLFHELELAHVAESPTRPEAGPEDVAVLAGLLATEGPLSALSEGKARRVRRWLGFVLSELTDAS